MSADDFPRDPEPSASEGARRVPAAVGNFSDEMFIAAHEENLRLSVDDLAEITRTELERRDLPVE
jgi:hypothetical protein